MTVEYVQQNGEHLCEYSQIWLKQTCFTSCLENSFPLYDMKLLSSCRGRGELNEHHPAERDFLEMNHGQNRGLFN